MDTRVEIFRDGLWRKLRLADSSSIKYNALINRIGKIDTREISHTNTFALPYVHQNIQALGINIFNTRELAKALNSKFIAKYYVEDKLLQAGYLIINNTSDGSINVNFIDEALSLTDKWGSITFNELLTSSSITREIDYQTAIDEMTDYNMDKEAVLTPLTVVGSRGHNLAVFPNNLNSIGDAFQIQESGSRANDTFNPYQSRPIFNIKALFDLAIESFDYIPYYDPSVDWSVLERSFMIDKDLGKNQRDDGSLLSLELPTVGSSLEYSNIEDPAGQWTIRTTFDYFADALNVLKPNDISGWTNPINFSTTYSEYRNNSCIYIPDIIESDTGEIRWDADIDVDSLGDIDIDIYSCWTNTSDGIVRFRALPITDDSTRTKLDVILSKAELSIPATNGEELIGIIMQARTSHNQDDGNLTLTNLKIVESYLPTGVISYDEWGQYVANTISLTHAAPKETVKDLLSAVMQKEGILMSINNESKVISLFSYGAYEDKKDDGNFYDWSEYLQKYNSVVFNTDYGNAYAKINDIGLTKPYPGNTFKLAITNQGATSKYKDYTTNYTKKFSDVIGISKILNITVPYFEYETSELSMVETLEGGLGPLDQQRADGTSQGELIGLKRVVNVNYAIPPAGVDEWYKLVDRAVKNTSVFLIPVSVIRELDISKPVFIDELGGFFIIEEVAEYVNAQTLVSVKLIKLIDDLKSEFAPPPARGVMAGTIVCSSDYDSSTLGKITGGSFIELEGIVTSSSYYDDSVLSKEAGVSFVDIIAIISTSSNYDDSTLTKKSAYKDMEGTVTTLSNYDDASLSKTSTYKDIEATIITLSNYDDANLTKKRDVFFDVISVSIPANLTVGQTGTSITTIENTGTADGTQDVRRVWRHEGVIKKDITSSWAIIGLATEQRSWDVLWLAEDVGTWTITSYSEDNDNTTAEFEVVA